MADLTRLTEAESRVAQKLDPRDAIMRTINFDHDGNAHILLMWPAKYVVSKGIVPPKMGPHDVIPE